MNPIQLRKEVIKLLRENRGRLPFIAKETGIAPGTISNIMNLKKVPNTGVNQCQVLYNYFMRDPKE